MSPEKGHEDVADGWPEVEGEMSSCGVKLVIWPTGCMKFVGDAGLIFYCG